MKLKYSVTKTLIELRVWYERWYEPIDINHTTYFNKNAKKMLLKLSKDFSIHATLNKNEVRMLFEEYF